MPSLLEVVGQDLVDGLIAPERVVGGMREDLVPEADLLQAVLDGRAHRLRLRA